MKQLLWASLERRGKKETLVLFRREAVSTARGPVLEDVTVFSLENPPPEAKALAAGPSQGVELELEVHPGSDHDTIMVSARIRSTDAQPQDPEIKRTNFDAPEGERRKRARGMGKYMGKESKPLGSPGTPPIPPEQRRGQRVSKPGAPRRPTTRRRKK